MTNTLIHSNTINHHLNHESSIELGINLIEKDLNDLTDHAHNTIINHSSSALTSGASNANNSNNFPCMKSASNDAFGFTIEPLNPSNFSLNNINNYNNGKNNFSLNFYDKNDKSLSNNRSGNNFSSNFNKKKTKYLKLNLRNIKHKKNNYNIGRWTEDEHRRFIEAILKYGNEWKSVQKHIKTRSSTQSRSHSQKFFLKIKNYDLFDFKDRKPCISSLNELAKNLNEKERENMLELLISYEYHDVSVKKVNSNDSKCSIGGLNSSSNSNGHNERLLNKKRKNNSSDNNSSYSSSNFDYELDDENISLINAGISAYSHFSKLTSTTANTKNNKNFNFNFKNYSFKNHQDDIIDEFNDQFSKAFLNSRLRRNSFEDNIFLLYADSIFEKGFSGRKFSISKKKDDISRRNSVFNKNNNNNNNLKINEESIDAFIELNNNGYIIV